MNSVYYYTFSIFFIVCIVLLIHPFWTSTNPPHILNEAFVDTTYTCKPTTDTKDDVIEYKYMNNPEWTSSNVTTIMNLIQTSLSKMNRLQEDIQNTLELYEKTEGSLEQSVRKKHQHWLKLSEKQRKLAKMDTDPITEYYNKLSVGRLPLGGLPDNEGKLPFGIPKIVFPDSSVLQRTVNWSNVSREKRTRDDIRQEQEFYRTVETVTDALNSPIKELQTNVNLLSWSIRDNETVSLYPRVLTIQRNIEEQKKQSNKKRGNNLHMNKSKEGFTTGSQTIKIVEIDVANYSVIHKTLTTYITLLDNLQQDIDTSYDDVKMASKILKQMDENAQKTKERIGQKTKL